MLRSRPCLCLWCVVFGTLLAALLLSMATRPALARETAARQPVSFVNEVAPIFKEACFGCHGAKNPKGKLDMTRYASLRKGGTKDDPVVPGKPEESYLLDVLTAPLNDKKHMPPGETGDPLSAEQIAVIARWIKEGAKLDGGIKPDADLLRELRLRWRPPTPAAAYRFPVAVTALAFTPDNKKLVVSGHHELTVWDIASGKLEKRIFTRSRRALAMLFLPDGKLAVAGGRPGEEGDVRLYDLNGGTAKKVNGVAVLDGVQDTRVMVKQLLDSDDEVLCLALSADGKQLASGGCDRQVHVWELGSDSVQARPLQTIENHADWVFGLAFTADGKYLATASRDKTAKIWDLAAQESLLTFPEHQNSVYGVAVSTDGKFAYSVGEDKQVRTWNLQGNQAGKQVRNMGGHGKSILKLIAHPSQPVLITASADQTVRLWNMVSGANVRTLSGPRDQLYAMALSPDGKLLAAGGFNGEVRIWKLADGSPLKTFQASPLVINH